MNSSFSISTSEQGKHCLKSAKSCGIVAEIRITTKWTIPPTCFFCLIKKTCITFEEPHSTISFDHWFTHIWVQHFYMISHAKCCSLMWINPRDSCGSKPNVGLLFVSTIDQMIQSYVVHLWLLIPGYEVSVAMNINSSTRMRISSIAWPLLVTRCCSDTKSFSPTAIIMMTKFSFDRFGSTFKFLRIPIWVKVFKIDVELSIWIISLGLLFWILSYYQGSIQNSYHSSLELSDPLPL